MCPTIFSEFFIHSQFLKKVHANTAANESLHRRLRHHHPQVDDYLKSKFKILFRKFFHRDFLCMTFSTESMRKKFAINKETYLTWLYNKLFTLNIYIALESEFGGFGGFFNIIYSIWQYTKISLNSHKWPKNDFLLSAHKNWP